MCVEEKKILNCPHSIMVFRTSEPWFFVIIKTKESHTADAVWLSLAGIAGLEPAMQESKSCALTDLAISHRYGVLYHIRRRCVKMTCGVLLSFLGSF